MGGYVWSGAFPLSNKNMEQDKHELELVNHPVHYNANGIEVIDIIEAFELNFNLGNSIKYIFTT